MLLRLHTYNTCIKKNDWMDHASFRFGHHWAAISKHQKNVAKMISYERCFPSGHSCAHGLAGKGGAGGKSVLEAQHGREIFFFFFFLGDSNPLFLIALFFIAS